MAVQRRKDNRNRVLKTGEYQRSTGTYEFKYYDKTGKRYSCSAQTLEKLREMEVEIIRDALDGIKIDKRRITVNDLYVRWKEIKRGVEDNTFTNYIYLYSKFIGPSLGSRKLADLKRSDVRSFYNYLVETGGLKVNSVDGVHTVLHQILKLGVEDDYLRYNPADGALADLKRARILPSDDEKEIRALTIQEQSLFEGFIGRPGTHHRWCPVFTVMLWTGMRVGEITGLRWCDIDLDTDTIFVTHTLVYYSTRREEGQIYAINVPKTKAGERRIPMLPAVKAAFLEERSYQAECGIKSNAVIDGYRDFIFLNRYGGVLHQGTLNRALKRIIRDCNLEVLDKTDGKDAVFLPDFTNHFLRHTFATRMNEVGMNLKARQSILGHTDVETTLGTYTDTTPDWERHEIQKLEFFDKNNGRRIDN